jgi:hypothetical protein
MPYATESGGTSAPHRQILSTHQSPFDRLHFTRGQVLSPDEETGRV